MTAPEKAAKGLLKADRETSFLLGTQQKSVLERVRLSQKMAEQRENKLKTVIDGKRDLNVDDGDHGVSQGFLRRKGYVSTFAAHPHAPATTQCPRCRGLPGEHTKLSDCRWRPKTSPATVAPAPVSTSAPSSTVLPRRRLTRKTTVSVPKKDDDASAESKQPPEEKPVHFPSRSGIQRNPSDETYREDLKKLHDATVSVPAKSSAASVPVSPATSAADKYIKEMQKRLVTDSVSSELSIPLLYDFRTIATVLSENLALLDVVDERDDVAAAYAYDSDLVWNAEEYDDKIDWDPDLVPEVRALIRIFESVVDPNRIVITPKEVMRDYGDGEVRLSCAKLTGNRWRLSLLELHPGSGDDGSDHGPARAHLAHHVEIPERPVDPSVLSADADVMVGEIVMYGMAIRTKAEAPLVRTDVSRCPGVPGSMSRLVRDIISSPNSDEQDKLVAGLHQRMWHAPAARLLPLLQAAGCPTAVLKRVATVVSSCKRCRMFAQPKHRPMVKAT